MRKTAAVLLCLIFLFTCCLPAVYADEAMRGVSYYIDSIDGSDETGNGLSPETAWKSVPVTECSLSAGDKVLFRRGGVYECTLTVSDSRGTPDSPIIISSYGEGDKPLLTTSESAEVLRLFDCSYVTVTKSYSPRSRALSTKYLIFICHSAIIQILILILTLLQKI
ncbi:MAG: hypothetical protein IJM45_05740 [Clostridia bacterium]|nr:hypothetical protein [Clostridia bacterium]